MFYIFNVFEDGGFYGLYFYLLKKAFFLSSYLIMHSQATKVTGQAWRRVNF
jgi:hypothetical protein